MYWTRTECPLCHTVGLLGQILRDSSEEKWMKCYRCQYIYHTNEVQKQEQERLKYNTHKE